MAATTFVTKDDVAEQIRLQIVRGELAPGDRLRPRDELKVRFNTTSATIQRAFDRLMEDGFVRSDGRRGTFVAESPPHLTRYALAFTSRPAANWSRFSELLRSESTRLEKLYNVQLPLYFEIDFWHKSPDYCRLLSDVGNSRVAGIVFVGSFGHVRETPLGMAPGVPRVSITVTPSEDPVAHVAIDYVSFLERATQRLAATGKRRIALFAPPLVETRFRGVFESLVASHGLESYPHWVQPIALHQQFDGIGHVVSLMMNPHQSIRPDAIIFADDHFTHQGIAALLKQGLRIPDDVQVVAHCNFPESQPAMVPVHRLGYEAGEILRVCLEALNQQRAASTPARSVVTVRPQFEDELAYGGTPSA